MSILSVLNMWPSRPCEQSQLGSCFMLRRDLMWQRSPYHARHTYSVETRNDKDVMSHLLFKQTTGVTGEGLSRWRKQAKSCLLYISQATTSRRVTQHSLVVPTMLCRHDGLKARRAVLYISPATVLRKMMRRNHFFSIIAHRTHQAID